MRIWFALVAVAAVSSTSFGGQPPKRPSDEERGLELYERHCWQCHGERNRGDGPATESLVHTVPNLSGGQTAADDPTVALVLRGKDAMPAFEASFDDADARRVLKFMASLGDRKSLTGSKPKPAPAPARPAPPPRVDDAPDGDEAEPGTVPDEAPPEGGG